MAVRRAPGDRRGDEKGEWGSRKLWVGCLERDDLGTWEADGDGSGGTFREVDGVPAESGVAYDRRSCPKIERREIEIF